MLTFVRYVRDCAWHLFEGNSHVLKVVRVEKKIEVFEKELRLMQEVFETACEDARGQLRHMQIHANMLMSINACAQKQTYMCTSTHMCMHSYACTYTNAYINHKPPSLHFQTNGTIKFTFDSSYTKYNKLIIINNNIIIIKEERKKKLVYQQ